jgi:hypothetical protein
MQKNERDEEKDFEWLLKLIHQSIFKYRVSKDPIINFISSTSSIIKNKYCDPYQVLVCTFNIMVVYPATTDKFRRGRLRYYQVGR